MRRSAKLAVIWLTFAAAPASAADAEADRVVQAVVDQYKQVKAVSVRATRYRLRSGGAAGDVPESGQAVVNESEARLEIDHWFAPPRTRYSAREILPSGLSGTTYLTDAFDGKFHTSLDHSSRRALLDPAGAEYKPIAPGLIHALGFCWPFAFQGTFADLLADRAIVTTKRTAPVAGRPTWQIDIKSLPATITMQGLMAEHRRDALTRLWVADAPHLAVLRWARLSRRDYFDPTVMPADPPAFREDGYGVVEAYIGSDFRKVDDLSGGPPVYLPYTLDAGNGYGSVRYTAHEMKINPAESPVAFRPPVPAGYTVRRTGDTVALPSVAGAAEGETIRVEHITDRAKQSLREGGVQAPAASGWHDWLGAAGAALVLLAGAVAGRSFLQRRRRLT